MSDIVGDEKPSWQEMQPQGSTDKHQKRYGNVYAQTDSLVETTLFPYQIAEE